MGTKCTVTIVNDYNEPVLTLQCMMDGGYDYAGTNIYDFVKSFTIVNGIRSNMDGDTKYANGIECLALQLVVHLKSNIGQWYACDHKYTEKYHYIIRPDVKDPSTVEMVCVEDGEEIPFDEVMK